MCINSTNPKWSPFQRTATTVYDITGDLIQYTTIDSNEFCLYFYDFPQSCAPFTVNATAYTQCSKSQPATFESKYSQKLYIIYILYLSVTGTNNESSSCECLKDKGKDISYIKLLS